MAVWVEERVILSFTVLPGFVFLSLSMLDTLVVGDIAV